MITNVKYNPGERNAKTYTNLDPQPAKTTLRKKHILSVQSNGKGNIRDHSDSRPILESLSLEPNML